MHSTSHGLRTVTYVQPTYCSLRNPPSKISPTDDQLVYPGVRDYVDLRVTVRKYSHPGPADLCKINHLEFSDGVLVEF